MKVSVKNNKGFSLVELMVVVAIIGILAAIAVPNFQKFTAKSKQGEARANLSSLYSAERAFNAEWQSYFADFRNIGYQPTGVLRYATGFGGAGAAVCPQAYNGTGAGVVVAGGAAVNFSTMVAAVCNQGTVPTAAIPCEQVTGPVAPGAFAGTSTAVTTFVADAHGDIDGDAYIDRWTIDQTKNLVLVNDDVNN